MNDVGYIPRRLFVVAAGNVRPPITWPMDDDFIEVNDADAIHDPAQAWNVLTVGAYTQLATLDASDPTRRGGRPLAPSGELSPYSTTSVGFADSWPIKPDVVFEGGNALVLPGDNVDFPIPNMSLLTTHHKPFDERSFDLMLATSAATAQAARLAALISAEYPEYWPETLRGLIVHSASWTPAMRQHLDAASGKRARAKLVRRYGFGVPSLVRALRSACNAAVLVKQETIRPYNRGAMREWHVHELPWPREVLADLGETQVILRVTLSYFIEPNPARRGWKRRYIYASHGLRFEVKAATETIPQFEKRMNQKALFEEEGCPNAPSDTESWFLGEQARNRGSLHSDIWEGTAADLAERGCIGVFPVGGWWKESVKRDRSDYGVRYALIVSIEAPEIEIDVWTPIAQTVGIPQIAVEIEI